MDLIIDTSCMDTNRTEVPRILIRTLKGLREKLALADHSGRILYENPAMRRVLDTERAAMELRPRIEEVARAVICRQSESGAEVALPGDGTHEVVALRGGAFQIRGHYLGTVSPGSDTFVLACLHRLPMDPITVQDVLKQRFHLTCQEIKVARLLAARRSNDEIARTLRVSSHTARHHTERVLAKLGIHSRTEVAGILGALYPARPESEATP